jgi:hypothetical protein
MRSTWGAWLERFINHLGLLLGLCLNGIQKEDLDFDFKVFHFWILAGVEFRAFT